MSKCKNCRKRKRNMDAAPSRPPRGSIRKARRDEMRAQKKRRMAELQVAELQVAELQATEETPTSKFVTHEISVEDSMRDVKGTSNVM